MKYIDAEKLTTIIEEKKAQQDQWINRYHDPVNQGISNELTEILSIITTLQQEQPELPGIKMNGIPGKDFIPFEWVDACERYGRWKIVRQEQPEVELEEEIERIVKDEEKFMKFQVRHQLIRYVASHFYELGKNARKED